MKTSNFANIANLVKAKETYASISLYPPSWYVGHDLKSLAPTPELFHAHSRLTQEQYKDRYINDVLSKLDPVKTYENICNRFGENLVLLCFEKPGEFCHRRLVAAWFEENLKIEVPEWTKSVKTSLRF